MTNAGLLVDEVHRLNGSIVLLVDRQGEHLRVRVPPQAGWLLAELQRRKPAVVAELRRRYLQRAEVRRVQ